MDSGWAVPTLKPGLSETVAAKVLIVARGRCDEVPVGRLVKSRPTASLVALALMLLLSAFDLAEFKAGRSSAAIMPTMTTTTNNSINVKARRLRVFIRDLRVLWFSHCRLLFGSSLLS
jgi:hypothetical protein